MSETPQRVRLSAALRALVNQVSPNVSAAHRALLLLGAQAAGYDVGSCRADTARLLAEELDEPVYQAVERLLGSCRTNVGPLSDSRPTSSRLDVPFVSKGDVGEAKEHASAGDEPAGDPFADLGFEV